MIEHLYCAAGILLGFGWTVLWAWMADGDGRKTNA